MVPRERKLTEATSPTKATFCIFTRACVHAALPARRHPPKQAMQCTPPTRLACVGVWDLVGLWPRTPMHRRARDLVCLPSGQQGRPRARINIARPRARIIDVACRRCRQRALAAVRRDFVRVVATERTALHVEPRGRHRGRTGPREPR